jgi:large subunit ribosomal protein L2
MGLKKLNPITPGQRFRTAPDFVEITASKPEKSLTEPLKRSGGRNNEGKMTMRYIGGGHKRRYRIIDFKRDKDNVAATVLTVEYDPNRSARIALIQSVDGEKRYIIAPKGIQVGQTVQSGSEIAPEVGNALPMIKMPIGTIIHCIELNPGRGARLARSAGGYAQIMGRDGAYVNLKLPSGEARKVLGACKATVGSVSNEDHMNESVGKAGRNRWLGIRPRVRGVAMNPVDHPMGGGEGKASGGPPRSRTGLYAKGGKTRKPNKYSDRLIISSGKK